MRVWAEGISSFSIFHCLYYFLFLCSHSSSSLFLIFPWLSFFFSLRLWHKMFFCNLEYDEWWPLLILEESWVEQRNLLSAYWDPGVGCWVILRYSQVGEPLTKKKHHVLFVLLTCMLTLCRTRLRGTSLVVQWLKLPTFPIQGALVQSLVKELDPWSVLKFPRAVTKTRWTSLMAQQVKNLPTVQETQETQVQSLGWEDPLEEEMATHSNILAWRIPIEPYRL